MSTSELLNLARAEGVSMVLEGGQLRLSADRQPPAELLAEIKAYRLEIIEALSAANDPPPHGLAWLTRVARLLGCSPDYLLTRGFIDRHDLAEQYRTHPRIVARLIRSHPDWSPPEPPAIELHDAGQPQHVHHCAATASPEWRQARDQYINHLMPCRACHAATDRYCVTGAELRQRYEQIPMESAP